MSEKQDQQKTGLMPSGAADGAAVTMVPAENNHLMNNVESIDLVELFFRILGSWKLILCMALIGAFGMGYYTTHYITPLYQATSVIYVLNTESVLNSSSLQLGNALRADYVKVFSLWELHEQVIENLNLPYSYSKARSMVRVSNTSDTRMLDIVVTSPDPLEAQLMANEYAEVSREYIAENMKTDKPTIMSKALLPNNPINIDRRGNIMKGFMAGMALACAIVAVIAILDDKIKTAEDIRKCTGLATLAVIPKNDEAEIKRSRSKKKHSSTESGGRKA